MHNELGFSPREVARLLTTHWKVWALPALAGFVLAAGYALITPRSWRATQGLLVRSEAAGFTEQRLGKFTDLAEMKTVQETVLEVARSESVVEETLRQVGPPPAWFRFSTWPTKQDVADFRQALRLTPPGGAEFGKTEVFYFEVLDKSVERAGLLVDALAQQVDRRLRELRNQRAESMIAELRNGAEQAASRLGEVSLRLERFEGSMGADLPDLRSLISPIGGPGESAQRVLAIEAELRRYEGERRQLTALLSTVQAATANPHLLLATPNSLLASQPSLQRLKDGLVDARLTVARLSGARTDSHPLVVAARESESHVGARLRQELPTALAGIELDLANNASRMTELSAELDNVLRRSAKISRHRTEYAELVAAVENQTQLTESARKQLADAEALRGGASTASILERIDGVESGLKPVGPGRTVVAATGGLAGGLLGMSVLFVFFSAPAPQPPAKRPAMEATDFGVRGRCATSPTSFATSPGNYAGSSSSYAGYSTSAAAR